MCPCKICLLFKYKLDIINQPVTNDDEKYGALSVPSRDEVNESVVVRSDDTAGDEEDESQTGGYTGKGHQKDSTTLLGGLLCHGVGLLYRGFAHFRLHLSRLK